MLLLDDGWLEHTTILPAPPRATLIFGRELEMLAAHVDRVLLLRGGRLVALVSPRVTPRRRVAESRIRDDAPAFTIR